MRTDFFVFSIFFLFVSTFPEVCGSLYRRRLALARATLSQDIELVPRDTYIISSVDDGLPLPFDHFESVTARLQIYIRANDASALFSELKANRSVAATLPVFDSLVPVLVEVFRLPPDHEMFLERNNAAQLLSSVIVAFIHFNVNVLDALTKSNRRPVLNLFIFHLKTLNRIPLSFFLLFPRFNLKSQFKEIPIDNFNFYAVNQAILLSPDSLSRINALNQLYDTFGADLLNSFPIPRRLFRDSPDVNLCEFVVTRGFKPSDHPLIFIKCRLPLLHPKWDYFAQVYGYRRVQKYLQSGRHILPETKFRYPFVVCPLESSDHPHWDLYSRAFGVEIVNLYKNGHI